tara:strand:+ start:419 stop:616 length:198 start_codon:yes stop_codon:yes gene_type:complete
MAEASDGEKKLQREKIAQDIKAYLARGGVITTYARGASGVEEKRGNPVWEKTLHHSPPEKKGKLT